MDYEQSQDIVNARRNQYCTKLLALDKAMQQEFDVINSNGFTPSDALLEACWEVIKEGLVAKGAIGVAKQGYYQYER